MIQMSCRLLIRPCGALCCTIALGCVLHSHCSGLYSTRDIANSTTPITAAHTVKLNNLFDGMSVIRNGSGSLIEDESPECGAMRQLPLSQIQDPIQQCEGRNPKLIANRLAHGDRLTSECPDVVNLA